MPTIVLKTHLFLPRAAYFVGIGGASLLELAHLTNASIGQALP